MPSDQSRSARDVVEAPDRPMAEDIDPLIAGMPHEIAVVHADLVIAAAIHCLRRTIRSGHWYWSGSSVAHHFISSRSALDSRPPAVGYARAMAFSSAFGYARSAQDSHWHRVPTTTLPDADAPPARVHAACGVAFTADGPIVSTRPAEGVCEACEAGA